MEKTLNEPIDRETLKKNLEVTQFDARFFAELTRTPERCADCKRDCRTAWRACEKEGEHDGRES